MPVTKVKPKNPRGRPQSVIDKERFEDLCKVQCTREQICGVLNIDHKTLNKWCKKEYGSTFEDVFAVLREGGLGSLRMTQFRMSETNPTMAIWLGKQYLHQADDPSRLARGEAVENKLAAFLDALTDAVGGKSSSQSAERTLSQRDAEEEEQTEVCSETPEDEDEGDEE